MQGEKKHELLDRVNQRLQTKQHIKEENWRQHEQNLKKWFTELSRAVEPKPMWPLLRMTSLTVSYNKKYEYWCQSAIKLSLLSFILFSFYFVYAESMDRIWEEFHVGQLFRSSVKVFLPCFATRSLHAPRREVCRYEEAGTLNSQYHLIFCCKTAMYVYSRTWLTGQLTWLTYNRAVTSDFYGACSIPGDTEIAGGLPWLLWYLTGDLVYAGRESRNGHARREKKT